MEVGTAPQVGLVSQALPGPDDKKCVLTMALQTKNLTELCILLIDDMFGELPSVRSFSPASSVDRSVSFPTWETVRLWSLIR